MAKDIKRFSYSRLNTFQRCPRRHYYTYIEQIETEESATTIPGKLFHEAMECYLTNKDMTPVFEKYSALCSQGKLQSEPDLLEYVVYLYLQYYAREFEEEQTQLVEYEFEDELDDGDKIVMIVDEVFYDKDNYLVVRDRKTALRALKYTQDDVMYNTQLYLYVPYVEDKLQQPVDAIEIDEVRLAKLQPVPLKNNGKPTIDKKQLDLVTYEAYYNALAERGLETEREFQPILEWLQQRGHPLFKRIRCQILDEALVSANAQEVLETYKAAKTQVAYRIKGPLCNNNFCPYKELCQLDYLNPSDVDREIIIKKITGN